MPRRQTPSWLGSCAGRCSSSPSARTSGHIGSCLSVVEILATLYGGVIRSSAPDDPDRDRFVMSKGHAALALYAALAASGRLDPALLDELLRRRQPACDAPGARRPRRRVLDRVARPRTLARRRRRARGADPAIRPTCLRADERRRAQRRLDVGGGDVRRPSPARESDRDRRSERPAGSRRDGRHPRPGNADRPLARVRLGCGRGRRARLRGAPRRDDARDLRARTSFSPGPPSARASRTWSGRSPGTTCR